MCFSATASFTASAVCGVMGAVAIHRRRTLINFIPLIFAAHQALEGMVWATGGVGLGRFAAYAFALIAYCFWPIYVPLAALSAAGVPRRRVVITLFLALGAGVAAFNGHIAWHGLEISLASGHVRYLAIPDYPVVMEYAYAASTVVPFLLCRGMSLRAFGLLLLGFFVFSTVFFAPARASVWCFFAALSSAVLVIHAYADRPREHPDT